MNKKITPQQVRNGTVTYTFETFLDKLWEDVKSTLFKENSMKKPGDRPSNNTNKKTIKEVFVFVYEICYMAAMNHPELNRMLEKTDREDKNIVQKILKSNKENIALLRAIFTREISLKLEQGLSERQAVKAAIEESKRIFENWKV